jgi:hypothetical protein
LTENYDTNDLRTISPVESLDFSQSHDQVSLIRLVFQKATPQPKIPKSVQNLLTRTGVSKLEHYS